MFFKCKALPWVCKMTLIPFRGARIALLHQGQLIAYQRDQRTATLFPSMSDLSGGGREDDESPQQCAIRETREEFEITINPEWIVWERRYPALIANEPGSHFLVAKLESRFGTIPFSDEGQQRAVMSVYDFLEPPKSSKVQKADCAIIFHKPT